MTEKRCLNCHICRKPMILISGEVHITVEYLDYLVCTKCFLDELGDYHG